MIHFMEWEWYSLDSSELASIIEMLILQPGPLISSSLSKKKKKGRPSVFNKLGIYNSLGYYFRLVVEPYHTLGPTIDGTFKKVKTDGMVLFVCSASNKWMN